MSLAIQNALLLSEGATVKVQKVKRNLICTKSKSDCRQEHNWKEKDSYESVQYLHKLSIENILLHTKGELPRYGK